MTVSLREFYENEWVDDGTELAKHAAANGMTPQEWQNQTVAEAQHRDEQEKIAAENAVIEGMVTSKGIKDGFAQELRKFAAQSGIQGEAANTLYNVFCK